MYGLKLVPFTLTQSFLLAIMAIIGAARAVAAGEAV